MFSVIRIKTNDRLQRIPIMQAHKLAINNLMVKIFQLTILPIVDDDRMHSCLNIITMKTLDFILDNKKSRE